MSYGHLEFDPGALDKAAAGFDDAAQDLIGRTQSLMGEVGDVSALGTNDTLGSIASMMYAVVLERVQETVDSIAEEYSAQQGALSSAAQAYRSTEEANAQLGASSVGGA